jgi:hypothetical protein
MQSVDQVNRVTPESQCAEYYAYDLIGLVLIMFEQCDLK